MDTLKLMENEILEPTDPCMGSLFETVKGLVEAVHMMRIGRVDEGKGC